MSNSATQSLDGRPIGVEQSRLDALFTALLLASFGALVFGNILMLNAEVFKTSVLIWIPTCGLLLIFYALSRLMGGTLRGLIVTLVVVFLLVRLRQPLAAPLFYVLTLAAAIYAGRCLRPRGIPWWGVLLMAVFGAIVGFCPYTLYNSFDNLNVARSGMIHKDALFHAAIAAMVKNYGVVSTGLHGLVETPNYAMAHYVVAALSLASGEGVLEVFGVVTQVLLIPLLVFCASCAAVEMKVSARLELVWVACGLMMVIPMRYLSDWGVNPQYLMSESSLLSSSLFILALPLLLKSDLRRSDVVWAVSLAALLSVTKASTAIIYIGLWGARWMVLRRLRLTAELAIAAMSGAVLLWFLSWFSSNGVGGVGKGSFEFLHYVRLTRGAGSDIQLAFVQWMKAGTVKWWVAYSAMLELCAFFFWHFLFSWVALGVLLWRRGLAVLWRSPIAICVWASMSGGMLALVLFADPHGNAYYFSHPAFLVALPACAAGVGASGRRLGRWAIGVLLVASIVWLCVLHLPSFIKHSRRSVLHATRHESAVVDALLSARRDVPLNIVLRAPPRVWLLEPVRWGGFPWDRERLEGEPWHSAAPFLYPAISERAWIGVIPPASLRDPPRLVRRFSEDPFDVHGYGCYSIDRVNGGVKSSPVLLRGMKTDDWIGPGAAAPQQADSIGKQVPR